jgi:hypothetical protein
MTITFDTITLTNADIIENFGTQTDEMFQIAFLVHGKNVEFRIIESVYDSIRGHECEIQVLNTYNNEWLTVATLPQCTARHSLDDDEFLIDDEIVLAIIATTDECQ